MTRSSAALSPLVAAVIAGVLVLSSGCATPPRSGAGIRARELGRLQLTSLDGAPKTVTGPGPTRLVEVWATWCEPCDRAAGEARRVLARHPSVVAYAVAVDGDRERVAAHPGRAAGQMLVVRGGEHAAALAGFEQFPTFLALDTRGRVIGELTGATPHLGAALERLLRNAEGHVGEP